MDASRGFDFPQDSVENSWLSENLYAQDPHFSDTELELGCDPMLGIQHPFNTTSPNLFDDAFPDICKSLQSCNSTAGQRVCSSSQYNATDGLYTFENLSTTSSADIQQSPSLTSSIDKGFIERFLATLEKLSVSCERISTSIERFSEKLDKTSTTVESFHSQAQSISNITTVAIDGFNVNVDSLSERIDGLAETVGEIVKRERIAMEKFGNFAGHVDQPTSSLDSQPGMNRHRRSSD
ncbi:uncharacterized protein BDV17DRAFT_295278 [Aspergillus undulatus]|uniref:uncharacterized protein n=1 Tax=Aspergillus undulatus TaxID=1810928 RepID=UPI003CCE073E